MMIGTAFLMGLLGAAVDPTSPLGKASPVADAALAAAIEQDKASGKACFIRRIVQKDGPSFDFEVTVPPGKQALASDAGYVPIACSGDAKKLKYFRQVMCERAEGNDAVQKRTIEVLGVDPRKICAAAKELKDAE